MKLRSFWVIVIAMGLNACGSQPLPTFAVEGTTVTIAIPGHFDVGYGLRRAKFPDTFQPSFDPNNTVAEDLQRGELVVSLVERDPPHAFVAWVPVQLVTRVAMDPASTHAYNGTVEHTQAIMFLNIPLSVVNESNGPTRELGLKITRYRRGPGAGNFAPVAQFAVPGWFGWGTTDPGPGDQVIPITIADAPNPESAHWTPVEGWDNLGTSYVARQANFTTNLNWTVPNPEFRIEITNDLLALPAAWEMDVKFPANRVEILGVRLLRPNPSVGIATWSVSPPTPPLGNCPTPVVNDGTLKIQVVDPDPNAALRSRGVAVIFKLSNITNTTCRDRITPAHIGLENIKAFDQNGVLDTTPPTFALVQQDLL